MARRILQSDNKEKRSCFGMGFRCKAAFLYEGGDGMSILEELWYGNVYPSEQTIGKDSEYTQVLHKVVDEKEHLITSLTPEIQKAIGGEGGCLTKYRSFWITPPHLPIILVGIRLNPSGIFLALSGSSPSSPGDTCSVGAIHTTMWKLPGKPYVPGAASRRRCQKAGMENSPPVFRNSAGSSQS